jgi:hypothetical protein
VFISGSAKVIYSAHAHATSIFSRPVTNVADANWYVLLFSTTCVDPHKNRNGNRVVLIMTISSLPTHVANSVTHRDRARLVSDLMPMLSPMLQLV